MYESLMFLAWGVTAVTLYFSATEQDAQEKAVSPNAASKASIDVAAVCASPVALCIVAFRCRKHSRKHQHWSLPYSPTGS